MKHKKIIIIVIVIILLLIGFFLVTKNNYVDKLNYKGKTYIYLENKMDIFTYGFYGNGYYDEDVIYPIKNKKWDIVYFNGDLFAKDKDVNEAKKYYNDDNNYIWFIVFDIDDDEKKEKIQLTEKELNYIYRMDEIKKSDSIKFDEIEMFASIQKVSNDKLISGIISLAYCKDYWYYKTEIMNDFDEEYVIKLPKSLNQKINDLLKKY